MRSEVQVLLDPPSLPAIFDRESDPGDRLWGGMPSSFAARQGMRDARAPERGLSSAGRAPDLHSGGQEFDPPRLHHGASAEGALWLKTRFDHQACDAQV